MRMIRKERRSTSPQKRFELTRELKPRGLAAISPGVNLAAGCSDSQKRILTETGLEIVWLPYFSFKAKAARAGMSLLLFPNRIKNVRKPHLGLPSLQARICKS